ncbi:hypothetical protein [Clavibacter michiganensis]|uniref:hypothetical protein n=1 Tax=Clavibacter michiganensis TaxID=28447 RepID=UPI003EBE905C
MGAQRIGTGSSSIIMGNQFGTIKQAHLLLALRGKARDPLPHRVTQDMFIEQVLKTPQKQVQAAIKRYNDAIGFIPTLSKATLTQVRYIWDLRAEVGMSNKVGAPTMKDLTFAEADLLIRELRVQAMEMNTAVEHTVAPVIDLFTRKAV